MSKKTYSDRDWLSGIFEVVDRGSVLAILSTSFIITILEVASVAAVIPAVGAIVGGRLPGLVTRMFLAVGLQSSVSQKVTLLVAIAVIFLVRGAALSAITFLQSRIVFKIQRTLSNLIFEKYLYAKFEFATDVASSTLIRSTTTELSNIANGILLSLSVLVSEVAMVSGVLLVLFYLQPVVAVSLLVVTLALLTPILKLNRKYLTRNGKIRLEMEENRVQLAQEIVAGIREIKVYGLESQLRKSIDDANQIYTGVLTRIHFLQCFPRIYFETIGVFVLLIVCAIQIFSGRSANDILMFLTVSGLAAFRALPSIAKSLSQIQQIRFYHPSLTAVLELLKRLQQEAFSAEASAGGFPCSGGGEPPLLNLSIKLENAAYRYDHNGSDVFNAVSVELRSGEMVGIVGPSGVGKSTFLDCIIGLRRLSCGSINTVDGDAGVQTSITVSYVPQTPVMLGGTILRNITLGNDDAALQSSSNLKLTKALEVSGLGELMALRGLTLSSNVVEGGRNFSGGQRQRLALARALNYDADVLVLDEATSALDKEAEQEILFKIRQRCSDKLVIMVTHRSELLTSCDKIIRMEPGGMVVMTSNRGHTALKAPLI
jgi:ABC-type multidrug transport system fused ATPase/permease subunit